MKNFGWMLLGVGLVWLAFALNIDTSVELPYGAGWPGRVQNLSLMEERRTHLMLSAGVIIVGVLLLGFGQRQRFTHDDEDDDGYVYRNCPFCAESVRVEALICKHCRSELPGAEPDSEVQMQGGSDFPTTEELEEVGPSLSYKELRAAAEAAKSPP